MVKPVLLVRPFRDYLPTPQAYCSVVQHFGKVSTKPMSQQYPSSHYQTAPYQTPGPAVSPSPMQVSYSTLHLQPSTRPQSPPTIRTSTDQFHTLYEINAHQSPEPPDINSQLSTTYCWQTVKKRKSPRHWLHGNFSPHSTHQIPLLNSRISKMTITKRLFPSLLQPQAVTQPRSRVCTNHPRYMYMALPTIVT